MVCGERERNTGEEEVSVELRKEAGGGVREGLGIFIGEKRTERRSLKFEELSWEGERKMKRRVLLLFWTKEQRKR
jgi:hypothetical protein